LNPLSEKIAREIEQQGTIPFSRFMELALYCPVYGYYEREQDTIGAAGDYITSVSVGPLYGQLLAFQLASWLETWAPGTSRRSVNLVELGAHDGRLAGDILLWLEQHRPALFRRLNYWIVESSARRLAWQQRSLRAFEGRVHWTPRIAWSRNRGAEQIRGIIFANEFLDALPVRRLGWDATKRRWFEWGVDWTGERFAWARLDLPAEDLREVTTAVPTQLEAVLPDRYTLEVCSTAQQWWRRASEALAWGALLAVDYGSTALEWLAPERIHGTLRAYRSHHIRDDLLADPGKQDITAHVDFAAIRNVGEAAGLKTELQVSQAQFLVEVLRRLSQEPDFAQTWTPSCRRQFSTLTHPEHLGRRFRVLVQRRL
jgi:SAM-dependent MidA family methyltransferase